MAMMAPALAAWGSSALSTAGLITAGVTSALAATKVMMKGPSVNVPKPEAPPQAAKTPDRNAALAANAAAAGPGGAMSGNSSTFLTGPLGVDSGSLNLGRNTLLGQ